jgi:mitochondrial fission protein ELM1
MSTQTCWIMSDGRRGIEIQCLALADALNLTPILKRIKPSYPWFFLPPSLCFKALCSVKNNPDPILPPWPDILITCGRQAVAISAAIRKKNNNKTFTIHIQDPKLNLNKFDVIVAPLHDNLKAPNVINALGSIHGINPEFLKQEGQKFNYLVEKLPKPHISVIIGGISKHHDFSEKIFQTLIQDLKNLQQKYGGSLLLTPSRRTPTPYISKLKSELTDIPHYLWEGVDPNPYFGMIALSDFLIVTCDSVNMATEAAASGKPLYIYHFDESPPKFIEFHQSLRDKGISRRFEGTLENWHYEPLLEINRIADRIREIYEKSQPSKTKTGIKVEQHK